MTVKQISVFLENKPGQLLEFTQLLESHAIDLRALSIADTKDFGILRIIVDDPFKAVNVAKEAGYVCSLTPVLAVEMPDRPGGLEKILAILQEAEINLEYTYAFISRRKDAAYMILRVAEADCDRAARLLCQNSLPLVDQEGLARLFQ